MQLAARLSAVKLLAPDCKTLSRARDIAIPGVPNPPCRLRSDEHPAGLPGLPPHLQKRVDMGNEMFEGAVVIADGSSNSGTAFLLEQPYRSYGWLLPKAKKLRAKSGVKFLRCYNCMKGGSRFKISGLLTDLDVEDQFEEVCFNIAGICNRTGLLHESIRPIVLGSTVVTFPTEEEAEYPAGMCESSAIGVERFLRSHPEVKKTTEFDFIEIHSGPNAPTTAAVVERLGSLPDLTFAASSMTKVIRWYDTENPEAEIAAMEAEVAEAVTGPVESSLTTVERSYHLLEDEERVNHILRSLPTEEYYSLLSARCSEVSRCSPRCRGTLVRTGGILRCLHFRWVFPRSRQDGSFEGPSKVAG